MELNLAQISIDENKKQGVQKLKFLDTFLDFMCDV